MKNGEHLRKFSKLQLDENPSIPGLNTFIRSLEREYFAQVNVRDCQADTADRTRPAEAGNLVIEMACNFDLVEILYHLEHGSWGKAENTGADDTGSHSAFIEAYQAFSIQNPWPADVEELSLVLRDTTIVIKKVYEQSIPEQLGRILQTLAAHYVHFTRGMTETPFEIYLPVFEEEMCRSGAPVSTVKRDENTGSDYFNYWALYFDSIPDGKIYDLSKKEIISGDLQMLNH